MSKQNSARKDYSEFVPITEWRKTHDQKSVENIIKNHYKMIKNIANRYEFLNLDSNELMAEAVIGLLIAIGKYDTHKNVAFSTYAYYWMKAKVLRFIQKNNSYSHGDLEDNDEEIPDGSLELDRPIRSLKYRHTNSISNKVDHIMESHAMSLEDSEELDQYKTMINAALLMLNSEERYIIENRWLNLEKKKLKEIAELFKCSIERVRQLEVKSFEKIKQYIKSNFHLDKKDIMSIGGV